MNWLKFMSKQAAVSGENTSLDPRDPVRTDQLTNAVLYRIKRDALMVIARMNHGVPEPEVIKRQMVFIQHQLVIAAIRDPSIPAATKSVLLAFQDMTVRESIVDRRGAKRRVYQDQDGWGQDEGVRLSVVR